MRIRIKEKNGRGFSLIMPTALLFNRLTAHIAFKAIEANYSRDGNGFSMPPEAVRLFITELKSWKRRNGPLAIVDVNSADGESVLITI
jgi:uncharacterized protein YaiL (DUF2058 family)